MTTVTTMPGVRFLSSPPALDTLGRDKSLPIGREIFVPTSSGVVWDKENSHPQLFVVNSLTPVWDNRTKGAFLTCPSQKLGHRFFGLPAPVEQSER
jgi:hypothetical protein